MKRKPDLLNEPRLRAMMERTGVDLVILRTNANSKYMSEFFHNGGNLGYRPFVVFYFRDPARDPALIVPRPVRGFRMNEREVYFLMTNKLVSCTIAAGL